MKRLVKLITIVSSLAFVLQTACFAASTTGSDVTGKVIGSDVTATSSITTPALVANTIVAATGMTTPMLSVTSSTNVVVNGYITAGSSVTAGTQLGGATLITTGAATIGGVISAGSGVTAITNSTGNLLPAAIANGTVTALTVTTLAAPTANITNENVSGTGTYSGLGVNPPQTQSGMTISSSVVVTAQYMLISSTGNITSTVAPFISTTTATTGEYVTLMVDPTSSYTITVQDKGTLTNSCLSLGATTRAIKPGGQLSLIYQSGIWRESGFVSVQ